MSENEREKNEGGLRQGGLSDYEESELISILDDSLQDFPNI